MTAMRAWCRVGVTARVRLGNGARRSGDAGFPGENWVLPLKIARSRQRNPACPSLPCRPVSWSRKCCPR